MEHKFFLVDGTTLANEYDTEYFLTSLGFDLTELYESLREILGEQDRVSQLEEIRREEELCADSLRTELVGFVDEVEFAIKKLESGKSGKGYTKTDIADYLRRMIQQLNY